MTGSVCRKKASDLATSSTSDCASYLEGHGRRHLCGNEAFPREAYEHHISAIPFAFLSFSWSLLSSSLRLWNLETWIVSHDTDAPLASSKQLNFPKLLCFPCCARLLSLFLCLFCPFCAFAFQALRRERLFV